MWLTEKNEPKADYANDDTDIHVVCLYDTSTTTVMSTLRDYRRSAGQ